MGIGSGDSFIADRVVEDSQEVIEAQARQVAASHPVLQRLADVKRVLHNWRTDRRLKDLPEASRRIRELEAQAAKLELQMPALQAPESKPAKSKKARQSRFLTRKPLRGEPLRPLP